MVIIDRRAATEISAAAVVTKARGAGPLVVDVAALREARVRACLTDDAEFARAIDLGSGCLAQLTVHVPGPLLRRRIADVLGVSQATLWPEKS